MLGILNDNHVIPPNNIGLRPSVNNPVNLTLNPTPVKAVVMQNLDTVLKKLLPS